MPEVIGEGSFDPADYAEELAAAPTNHHIGSTMIFENKRVGVWEVRLQPGERGAFHIHDKPYFWTVVDAGIGRQRTDDGTYKIRRYDVGDTSFQDHSHDDAMHLAGSPQRTLRRKALPIQHRSCRWSPAMQPCHARTRRKGVRGQLHLRR